MPWAPLRAMANDNCNLENGKLKTNAVRSFSAGAYTVISKEQRAASPPSDNFAPGFYQWTFQGVKL